MGTRIHTIQGSALLYNATVTLNNSTYPQTVTSVPLSVEGLKEVTWLAKYLQLWDRFRFTRLQLEWKPAVGLMTNGQVAAYYDPNPNGAPPSGVEEVAMNANQMTGPVNRRFLMTVNPRSLHAFLWFDSSEDLRTSTQGKVHFLVTPGSIPSVNGKTALGNLWIHYQVQVQNQSGANQPVARAAALDQPELLEQSSNQLLGEIHEVNNQILAKVSTLALSPGQPGLGDSLQEANNHLHDLTQSAKETAQGVQDLNPRALQTMLTGPYGALNDRSDKGYYRIRARADLPSI